MFPSLEIDKIFGVAYTTALIEKIIYPYVDKLTPVSKNKDLHRI